MFGSFLVLSPNQLVPKRCVFETYVFFYNTMAVLTLGFTEQVYVAFSLENVYIYVAPRSCIIVNIVIIFNTVFVIIFIMTVIIVTDIIFVMAIAIIIIIIIISAIIIIIIIIIVTVIVIVIIIIVIVGLPNL